MYRFFSILALGACLMTPVMSLHAQDPHEKVVHAREWNDAENPYWHQYLKEQHRKDHEWAKATKKEQVAYWKWRERHPDAR